jgi:hypothetical protein
MGEPALIRQFLFSTLFSSFPVICVNAPAAARFATVRQPMRRASTMSPIGSPAPAVSPVNFFLDFNEKLLCFDLGSKCNRDFSPTTMDLAWK